MTSQFYAVVDDANPLHLEDVPLDEAIASIPEKTYIMGYNVCLSDTASN